MRTEQETRKAETGRTSFLFLEVTKGRDKLDTSVPKHIATTTSPLQLTAPHHTVVLEHCMVHAVAVAFLFLQTRFYIYINILDASNS